ncbi:hypothetical protein NC651_027234 [Populus alba x Populus x berolinensis]|nr:hypothetical protein NC651_027234 [Populus alba x Populus x berolinensis]
MCFDFKEAWLPLLCVAGMELSRRCGTRIDLKKEKEGKKGG